MNKEQAQVLKYKKAQLRWQHGSLKHLPKRARLRRKLERKRFLELQEKHVRDRVDIFDKHFYAKIKQLSLRPTIPDDDISKIKSNNTMPKSVAKAFDDYAKHGTRYVHKEEGELPLETTDINLTDLPIETVDIPEIPSLEENKENEIVSVEYNNVPSVLRATKVGALDHTDLRVEEAKNLRWDSNLKEWTRPDKRILDDKKSTASYYAQINKENDDPTDVVPSQ
ncbi:MAG: hypothetical protein GY714_14245, partial [Desulfobacterales bacterium]|nr:hypothetical protein [Desulfobacterales bacterium]